MREELQDLAEAAEQLSLPVVPEALTALDELYWGPKWEGTFTALAALQAAVRELERSAVRMARIDDRSWEEIGRCLGLTRHGARKRYGLNDLEELDAMDELHYAETQALHGQIRSAVIRARGTSEGLADGSPIMIPQELWQQLMAQIQQHGAARRELIEQLEVASEPHTAEKT